MTIYRYATDSPIDEVRIVTNPAGGMRAYLRAQKAVTNQALQPLKWKMNEQGWKCTPHSEDNNPSLEIRGFDSPDALFNLLDAGGWIKGTPALSTSETPQPWRQRLGNITLKATGYVYNIGDAAYMVYALMGNNHAKNELKEAQALTSAGVDALNAKRLETLAEKITKNANPKKLKELAEVITKESTIVAKTELVAASKLNIKAGIGYAIGGAILTFFGSKDQSRYEIKEKSEKVKSFLRQQGGDISAPSSLNDAVKKDDQGIVTQAKHFLSRYPSEILNVIYTGVGLYLASHAFRSYKVTHDFSDKMDIGLGAITTSSSLAGILIKEKKPMEGQPKREGLAGVWDWVQEKPLRATGIGFMVATACHAASSFLKYREGDKLTRRTVLFRVLFVASNVVAECLMALSSKGHGSGVKADESIENTLIANTAEVIAQQPEAKRGVLVDDLACYLSSPDVMGGKRATIATTLHTQVKNLAHNPWAAAPPYHNEPSARATDREETPTNHVTSVATINGHKTIPLVAPEIAQPQHG